MTGAVERELVLARRVLLDALSALGDQRSAVILVGAQAIYLHVGEGGLPDIAVQPITTDADLSIDPDMLADDPRLAEAMAKGSFTPGPQSGMWYSAQGVRIDLMVPESLGGRPGRRGADLGSHGKAVARQARGLEAALVDSSVMVVPSLAEDDTRSFQLRIAGPAALLVAKMHKLSDRKGDADRLAAEDALDVLRLLRGCSAASLASSLRRLAANEVSAPVTDEALGFIRGMFAHPESPGSVLAGRAVETLGDEATIAASCAALAQDLLDSLGH